MSGSKRKSSGAVAGTAKKCPLLYWTAVLFKVLSCKIKNVFFIFLCLFLCIIRVKSIINLLQYNTIDYVSWVPRLTLLDLQTNWTYECAPGTRLNLKPCPYYQNVFAFEPRMSLACSVIRRAGGLPWWRSG